MPASSINLYHMQDAKNNFSTMRPAPVCTDTNILMGHCQNVHISRDCYYGYHDSKGMQNVPEDPDCEMEDLYRVDDKITSSPKNNTRKRSAEDSSYPQTKRQREEIQIKKNIYPETIEKEKLESSSEDMTETLYWNLHGGNFYHLLQCL